MGENLWQGPRRVSSYEVMIDPMVDEVRNFPPGIIPAVSATREWHDVGHYTQIIWPHTTEIGCGVASGADRDFLVCRYAPTGNKDGLALIPRVQVALRK
jgi:hypothetical protein